MLRPLFRIWLALTAVIALAACDTGRPASVVTRQDNAVQFAALSTSAQEQQLARQADILTARTAEILRKATMRGAGLGAAAGCGLGLATGTGAGRCVGGALAGGVVGAAVGHASGQAQLRKRIEFVAPSPLIAGLSRAGDAVETLDRDLPDLLKAQDAELDALRQAVQSGSARQAQYDKRVAEIAERRRQLASALELSARQASDARDALRAAQDQGQAGLDWHLHQSDRIRKQAVSARSAISLL